MENENWPPQNYNGDDVSRSVVQIRPGISWLPLIGPTTWILHYLITENKAKIHHHIPNHEETFNLIIMQCKFVSFSKYFIIDIVIHSISIKEFVYRNDSAISWIYFDKLFLFNLDSIVQREEIICLIGYNLFQHLIYCIYNVIKLLMDFLYLHFVINVENKISLLMHFNIFIL